MMQCPILWPRNWGVPASVVLAATVCFGGCGGRQQQFTDHDWTKEPVPEQAAWREAQSLFRATESDAGQSNYELAGVRLDLTKVPEAPADVRCPCIDAVVGTAGDGKFRWAGERPTISGKHLLFAFTTEGSQCSTAIAGASLRPSIQAVDTRGGNVVVVLEELAADRPQALGAIIPRPAPGGAVYVRPRRVRKRPLPYAQSVRGKMCLAYRRPGAIAEP